MLAALRSFFKQTDSSSITKQSPLQVAVFAENDKGTIGALISGIVQKLQHLSGQTVAVQYYTEINTQKQLQNTGIALQSRPVDLILTIGQEPTINVATLRKNNKITAPIIALAYQDTPIPPIPHTKVLFYRDDTETMLSLFSMYGNPLKKIIIGGERSKLKTVPMFTNLIEGLEKKNIEVTILAIDEEVNNLERFMASHAPGAQLIYLPPDGNVLCHQKKIIPLAHKHGCSVITAGFDASSADADVFAGIDYNDIMLDAARCLLKASKGVLSWQSRLQRAPLTIKFFRHKKRPPIELIEKFASHLSPYDQLIL